MSRIRNRVLPLLLVNVALLTSHEVDSAYWHEWEMFHLPGGIGLFVVLNVLLSIFVLMGVVAVARRSRTARWFSWMIVALGLIAVTIHAGFLASGAPQFRSPVSIALLAATGVVSVLQGIVQWRMSAQSPLTFDPVGAAEALRRAWSIDSSSKWTAECPASGQCSPTALVIQDVAGGTLLKTPVEGGWHFYNEIGGHRYDFTAEQFGNPPEYSDVETTRDDAFTDCTVEQYMTLKRRYAAESARRSG